MALRRTPMRRRLPRSSKRLADPVTPEVYQAVMRRDRACVASPAVFGVACQGRTHWHHRLPVEHGGPSTVPNGLRLCARHHDRVHRYRELARGLGLLVARGEDPALTPVQLWDGRVVLLTAAGDYGKVA